MDARSAGRTDPRSWESSTSLRTASPAVVAPDRWTLCLIRRTGWLLRELTCSISVASRPARGAEVVPVEVEIRRVIPVIEHLVDRVNVPISVDTSKPAVARLAAAAGAAIINDITGLADREMLELIAATDLGIVVMHIQGNPRTMQLAPQYGNVIAEVHSFLADRIEVARQVGISPARIAIDPGIGFGKSLEHNLTLLQNLRAFEDLGCPILVGTSRKGFLGKITGRAVADRMVASVASALAAADRGATIVRVHDVAATRDALLVWAAQHGWDSSSQQSSLPV